MTLAEGSYRWAIDHIFKESDTDLFPRPFELQIIHEMKDDIILELLKINLSTYQWNMARRFIVPKDATSARAATQLDPIDSIVLAAIVYQFGNAIESRRVGDNKVFSYRFRPTPDGRMYSNTKAWNKFWEACKYKVGYEDEEGDFIASNEYETFITCDITDFYNQISLNTIIAQLGLCNIPSEATHALQTMLALVSNGTMRGIPVGPHACHLLAELALINVDNIMAAKGIRYIRYADDFAIFCESEKQAKINITQLSEILDNQDRLNIQNTKTKFYSDTGFLQRCNIMLMDNDDNATENEIIDIIMEYTGGNAYARIKLYEIKDKHLKILSSENIQSLLNEYLGLKNYEKLRWLYRRLSQIGIPHAVDYSIRNFEDLIPAINDVCLYINSCAENYNTDWKSLGAKVLEILKDSIVTSTEFFKISLLNLFVYNKSLNHFKELAALFDDATPHVKRKILLASLHVNAAAWLRDIQNQYNTFPPWTKRAYMIAAKALPASEKRAFYDMVIPTLKTSDILERIIIQWALK